MKKYLFIVLLVGVCFGRDYLITLDGREFPGKYISHNETILKFDRDDAKGVSSISIDAIKGVRLENGNMVRLEVPQDIISSITLKNGLMYNGYIESFSLENKTSEGFINFKTKLSDEYKPYDKKEIRIIKSWNEKILFPFGVLGNKLTGKYHLPNVRHKPSDNNSKFFNSRFEAEKEKFISCFACFDNSPTITDFQLEKALVKQTILALQNNHEILYEHKDLKKVRNLVSKILKSWPESLKGYDYRVQILRDDYINAYAVGGGNLYVTSGLLEAMENDLELEAVLAHEIAHVEKRHTLKQFYLYEKKKSDAALQSLLAGLTVAALGGSAEQTNAAVNIVSAISSFASDFVRLGYKRELEQEADILAQIYFSNNKLEKNNIITFFDRLIAYEVTRGRSIVSENSPYNTHPSLLSRIRQVETSEVYSLENPVILSSNNGGRTELFPGFIEMRINHLFKFQVGGKKAFYILGDFKNNHRDFAFNIEHVGVGISDNKIKINEASEPSSITTKDGKVILIEYISHDEKNISYKYIGKDNIITVPIKALADYHIDPFVEQKEDNNSEKDIAIISGLIGSTINYNSQSSFMGIIEGPMMTKEKIFEAIKKQGIKINSIQLSPMVLKNQNKNINLKDFGSINAMMSISN